MNKNILTSLRPALVMTLLFALLLGITYPMAITGIAQLLFPTQANGSLVVQNGKVIGSSIVGQAFTSERYFHTRPSAAGKGYDGLASSGSNLGPASQALAKRVEADLAAIQPATQERPVPPDLVTASASGLDPHISPEAAFFQIDRVARVRGLDNESVRRLVERNVERPILGFIGEPRVNVLELNRRLDGASAKPSR